MDDAAYVAGNPELAGSDRLVVVSGCSGGGKSALVAEMARRGWTVFLEPGRQIVKQQALIGRPGLPWVEPARFAELALLRAMHFFDVARPWGRAALFDRSVVDAVTALERLGVAEAHHAAAVRLYRYARRVFLVPPWQALFAGDAEHGFGAAVAEYEALVASYAATGYATVVVPRAGVAERADFLEAELAR